MARRSKGGKLLMENSAPINGKKVIKASTGCNKMATRVARVICRVFMEAIRCCMF
ncbi:hypothetical protein D3C81_2287630 [compost metagenome]